MPLPVIDAERETLAAVLERAAGLLEPIGAWTRGDGGPRGALCAGLAIDAAANQRRPLCIHAREFFARHIGGVHTGDVFRWNDSPERTQAEVIAKLREAATKARTGAPE